MKKVFGFLVEAGPNLVAWYEPGRTENDTDASGNGDHIERRIGYAHSDSREHKGIINTAIELDGGQNRVLILPYKSIKDQTTGDGRNAGTTISLWVYATEPGNAHGIFLLASSDGAEYTPALFIFGNDPEAIFLPISTGLKTLAINKWHHIAIASNEPGQSFYLDGEKVASRNNAISHLQMSSNFLDRVFTRSRDRWLKPDPDVIAEAYFYFKGRMDDVRLYQKCLSDAAVKDLSKE